MPSRSFLNFLRRPAETKVNYDFLKIIKGSEWEFLLISIKRWEGDAVKMQISNKRPRMRHLPRAY